MWENGYAQVVFDDVEYPVDRLILSKSGAPVPHDPITAMDLAGGIRSR